MSLSSISGYLIFKINNSSSLGVGGGGRCPLNHDDDEMIVAVCYELGKFLSDLICRHTI